MDPVFQFVERRFKPPNIGEIGFRDGDLISVPSQKIIGVGIDDTVLCVDIEKMISFRMKFCNIGGLYPFQVLRPRVPFDLQVASQFFGNNQDNPYAVFHFIHDVKDGLNVNAPTQYPPLNARKDEAVQQAGLLRIAQASQTCDLLFMTVRNSGVSNLIRKIDRCQFSHVGMIARPGILVDLTISGMNQSHLLAYADPAYDLALYRPRFPMSEEGKAAVVAQMNKQVEANVQYSWPKVLKIFLHKRWGWKIKVPPTPGDLLAGGQFQLIDFV